MQVASSNSGGSSHFHLHLLILSTELPYLYASKSLDEARYLMIEMHKRDDWYIHK